MNERKPLWSERIKIRLSPKQLKKLTKNGRCKAMVNYQWYIIEKSDEIDLFDASGKRIDIKTLKRMLRGA